MAAVDDADRQDREAVAQAGRIQRQGQVGRLPAREDPGQQRAKQVVTSSWSAPLARLGGGRLVELLESGATGVKAYLQAQLVSR